MVQRLLDVVVAGLAEQTKHYSIGLRIFNRVLISIHKRATGKSRATGLFSTAVGSLRLARFVHGCSETVRRNGLTIHLGDGTMRDQRLQGEVILERGSISERRYLHASLCRRSRSIVCSFMRSELSSDLEKTPWSYEGLVREQVVLGRFLRNPSSSCCLLGAHFPIQKDAAVGRICRDLSEEDAHRNSR